MTYLKYLLLLVFLLDNLNSSSRPSRELFQMDAIDRKVKELMKEGDIPGLTLVVIRDGKEIIKSYGYANLDLKTPVTPATRFELGSCSKSFTALAFLRFAEENNINLDAEIQTFLPWLMLEYKGKAVKVSLRQLLQHTSGIPWNTISLIPESGSEDALEKTVRRLIGQKLQSLPGTQYEYATLNYDVLALVIQKVTGRPFEVYMNTLFETLKLHNTSIGVAETNSLEAAGYKIGFFKPIFYHEPEFKGNNAAAYIISDGNDVLKWMRLQLGLELSPLDSLIRRTQQRDETVAPHYNASYAMGWEVSLEGQGNISHSGQNPAFTAYMIFRKKAGTGLAVLANVNSAYTPYLGDQLFKIINGEKMSDVSVPDDQYDTSFSMLSIAFLMYIFIVTVFMCWIIAEIIRRKRKYVELTIVRAKNYLLSVLLILPYLYALYIFPSVILKFNWKSALIWLPFSFQTLIVLVAASIVFTYIASLLTVFFPQKNQYKQQIPKILLLSIISGFANVGVIILITSSIGSDIPVKYLLFYYLLIISIYLLGRRYVQVKLVKFTKGLVYELRVSLISKMLSTSYYRFEKINVGRIYTALNDDVSRVGDSTNVIVLLFSSTVTVIGVFAYLISIAFWAAILTISFILILLTLYNISIRRSNKYLEEARDEINVFMNYINDLVHGYKEISLHRNKKLEFKNDVSQSAERYKSKSLFADIKLLNSSYIGELILMLLLGLSAYGIREFFPYIQTHVIMSFVIILLYLIGPINRIVETIPAVMQIKIAWNRIHQFLEEIPVTLALEQPMIRTHMECNTFRAKGICFHYKSEDGNKEFAVGPIDLEVQKGEIIFIVGGNGSGKTTLAKLLTGLYEPIEGEFMINDQPIKSNELGEYFSTVFSPAHLFQKLYDINIEGREKEVENYLKMLHLDGKVSLRNNQYSTIKLSSGQRKRLALLQCFIEDRPIYLFDEWAADQDPDYRKFFYRILLPKMRRQGKIVVAITHDDNYFDIPDKVLKMEMGKLKTLRVNQPVVEN